MSSFDFPFPFIDGYLSWITTDYATVVVAHHPRSAGRSNYTFGKLLRHTISIFVTFSDVPLRAASWLGMTAFMVGMLWFAAIVGLSVIGGISVSGFASIMGGIVLFGGLQLLILGVIGEYLARVNFIVGRRPLFLVGRRCEMQTAKELSNEVPGGGAGS